MSQHVADILLGQLVQWVRVIVVDGSEPEIFQGHAARFLVSVVQFRPTRMPGANRTVAGLLTGARAAQDKFLVIADEDVC